MGAVAAAKAKSDPCILQPLKHHTKWRGCLQLVESHPEESSSTRALQSLNLSHNAFEWVPPVLACNAPQLARLSLAYNKLIYVGPLNCYPAQIRHLDLSCNQIGEWLVTPTSPHVEPCSADARDQATSTGGKRFYYSSPLADTIRYNLPQSHAIPSPFPARLRSPPSAPAPRDMIHFPTTSISSKCTDFEYGNQKSTIEPAYFFARSSV